VKAMVSINKIGLHWVRLLVGWLTVCRQENHFAIHKINSAFHPSGIDKSSTGLSGCGNCGARSFASR